MSGRGRRSRGSRSRRRFARARRSAGRRGWSWVRAAMRALDATSACAAGGWPWRGAVRTQIQIPWCHLVSVPRYKRPLQKISMRLLSVILLLAAGAAHAFVPGAVRPAVRSAAVGAVPCAAAPLVPQRIAAARVATTPVMGACSSTSLARPSHTSPLTQQRFRRSRRSHPSLRILSTAPAERLHAPTRLSERLSC